MPRRREKRARLLWYLIAILIGLAGVLFSRQLQGAVPRFSLVLLSVAIPLFAGGNLLARHHGGRIEKLMMLAGVLMLLLGAAASISDLSEMLMEQRVVPQSIVSVSRGLGLFSLLLGMFVVLYSMTRSGEAIEELAERFGHLADHISEGFVLSTPDGMIAFVNQRFLDMLHLKEDEVIGESSRVLARRLGVEPMLPHIDIRAKGLASEYEIAWQVKGEERQFWISGTPVHDRRGRETGILATVRDVTERNRLAKRVQRYAQGLQQLVEDQRRKLILSEERFRNLLLHMNEGFLTIDSSYRIQFANNWIRKLLRVDPDAIKGRDIFDFVDPSGRVRLLELLTAAGPRQGLDTRLEVSFICSDGRAVPTVAAVAAVRETPDDERSYSLVVTDVSELKQMQEQLELRAYELQSANEELMMHDRAKDGFLSNVSHELRTPLSTINGYVEMLQGGDLGELHGPQCGALDVMQRNVGRLVSIINELIEFSRMEIRGTQMDTRLFSPASLVHESVASEQPQILAKDLSVNMFIPEGFAPAWGDRDKLGQVLTILLSNAIKFSHEGGMIHIRASERSGNTLAIAMSDTGIGIAPKYHARVFDKFYQVDSSKTRRYEGMGIGLSISRSIVEAHKGHIELESEAGKGSTFTVVLPSAIFDGHASPESGCGPDERRALVVIEEDVFRAAVRSVLEAAGWMVDEAGNGYECMRAAIETAPDVICLDGAVSAVAGSSPMSNLQENPATCDVPIVLLTCGGGIGEDGTATVRGVSLLEKPFTATELAASVRDASLRAGEVLDPDTTPKPKRRTDPSLVVLAPDPDLFEWLETALKHRNIACHAASDAAHVLDVARYDPPDAIFVGLGLSEARMEKAVGALHASETTRGVPVYVMANSPGNNGVPEHAAGMLEMPFAIGDVEQAIREARAASAATREGQA